MRISVAPPGITLPGTFTAEVYVSRAPTRDVPPSAG
jgi:hypothetical protein